MIDEAETKEACAGEEAKPFAGEKKMEERSKDDEDNKSIHKPKGIVVFIEENAFKDIGYCRGEGFTTGNKLRKRSVGIGDCKKKAKNVPDEVGDEESFDAASEFLFVERRLVIAKKGNAGNEKEEGNCYGAEIVGKEIANKTGGCGEIIGWNLVLIDGRIMNGDNEKDGEKGKDGFLAPKVVKFG